MEQENSSMRERLLARLPQPQNLVAYREETAALMAKHERALFWQKWTTTAMGLCACGLFLTTFTPWGKSLGSREIIVFDVMSCILFFIAQIYRLELDLGRNHVNLLKEVKQVQLQVLELQDSIQKQSPNTPHAP